MVNYLQPRKSFSAPYINVQSTPKLPESAILLYSLKPLEKELAKRNLLPEGNAEAFYPLWFLAETERNIFLWRNGCSLIQQDEFEFWIDLEALVIKRLKQVGNPTHGNPFVAPNWDIHGSPEHEPGPEVRYLEEFRDAIHRIGGHVHALSRAATMVMSVDAREIVLLPHTHHAPG